MNPRLKVQSGEQTGQQYEIPPLEEEGEIVLGRSSVCDVQIHDRKLSRQHCRFIFDGGRLFVEDLESKNGTELNGRFISEVVELHDGDRLEVGSNVFAVEHPDERGPEVEEPEETVETPEPREARPVQALEQKEFAGLELEEKIHESSYCIIYRGRDENGREAAVKLLRPRAVASAERVGRFQRGAELASGLEHRNLVKVFDFGVHDNVPYLVMEYVAGENLYATLQESGEPLSMDRALSVAREMLSALQEVHEHRMVMRSVRPDNVLLNEESEAKLCDYGLLKTLPSEQKKDITQVVTVGPFGDSRFAAPEMITRPIVADHRCDIFGVGACLYYMLTASPPFSEPDEEAHPYRVFQRPLKEPHELNRDISPSLSRVIMRSMSDYLDKRYQTARGMSEALEGL
jgi:serine/threonine protein kinase